MGLFGSLFMLIGVTYMINLVECTEFVPVYMWSTKRINDKVPALTKMSQDTFKDVILEQLKNNVLIIIFAEQTLSPEDFAQHDQSGGTVFPHLAKLTKSSKVTYLPYVQNPIHSVKHIDASVSKASINTITEDFENSLEYSETDILIINLNDAKEGDNRPEMLKRHDALICSIYDKFAKSGRDLLALYTAYHESWVASEDFTSSRKARSLLQADSTVLISRTSIHYIYSTEAQFQIIGKDKTTTGVVDFTASSTINENKTEITLKLQTATTSPSVTVEMFLINSTSVGYWQLRNMTAEFSNDSTTKQDYTLTSFVDLYAPTTFSYHCGDQVFQSEEFVLLFKNFQLQLFFNELGNDTVGKFSDAYDCVGFTSIPIWSGIFITAILLMILTFGITMMMDIRTMDKFDDAKGKTITINAE